jgi:predicted porin
VKKLLVAFPAMLFISLGAYAQSSVTIYGIIDDGLTWSSNQGGKSAWKTWEAARRQSSGSRAALTSTPAR